MKTFTYKKLLYVLLLLGAIILAPACTNTSKLVNSGNYDLAIDHSVKKLRKNKKKEKYIISLRDGYKKANQRDIDRIQYLKQDGQPDNSVEIFSIYEKIKYRQEKVKPLIPLYLNGTRVQFEFLNIDEEIIAWKREAAGYLYSSSMALLATKDKLSARKAYDQLRQVKDLYNNYKDVDAQIQNAYNMGINWVYFDVDNNSINLIPREFMNELFNMNFLELESKWTKIIPNQNKKYDIEFDYTIVVNIREVNIGPESSKEVHYDEVKEIEDGWIYLKDDNGNIKKDSLGNDIKIPKYKEISAHVTEIRQTKIADFGGSLDIYDERTNRKITSEPFKTTFVFDHFSAVAQGNINALKPETKKKLGNKPVPFPSNFQMVMDGNSEIKNTVRSIIKRKRYLLET